MWANCLAEAHLVNTFIISNCICLQSLWRVAQMEPVARPNLSLSTTWRPSLACDFFSSLSPFYYPHHRCIAGNLLRNLSHLVIHTHRPRTDTSMNVTIRCDKKTTMCSCLPSGLVQFSGSIQNFGCYWVMCECSTWWSNLKNYAVFFICSASKA